jgi:hypothetical protein
VRYLGKQYSDPYYLHDVSIVTEGKWMLFKNPKIIIAGMVTRLEAAFDDVGFALGVNVFTFTDYKVSPFFLLSLLNSAYLTEVYRTKFESKHLAGGFLAINKGQLEQIPIRCINFTTSEKEGTQLFEQAKKLYQQYLETHDKSMVLTFVSQQLPQTPDGAPDTEHEHSDVIHDLLAFLAEEMTRLNKEKQSKIKGFLAWLEKEILKGSVEDQKNKTKIKDFHESTFEDLLDVLKKNKVVPDPCPANVRDTIAGEFSAAMNVLTPLKARIKANDNLIDRIVYRLYGLTDDEIVIVEGQQSHDTTAQN